MELMRPVFKSILALLLGLALAGPVHADPRQQLLEQYRQLQRETSRNPFDEPIFIRSQGAEDQLGADIYAVLQQPFEKVRAALAQADDWCRFLMLNQNVKACTWRPSRAGTQLSLFVGRKEYQQPQDAFRVTSTFDLRRASQDFLGITLRADEGPLGTQDYRIGVQAARLPQGTLVHLSWGYEDSLRSRMATEAYLATLGRNKVGFTVVGKESSGAPRYVQGVRGIIERNAMRYYLALSAYLQTEDLPPNERREASMAAWFRMIEQHPRQLHELSREEYFANKRREWQNQRLLQQRIADAAQARADTN